MIPIETAPSWLMENAGPVIRYRTATELVGRTKLTKRLESEWTKSALVSHWLGRLGTDCGRSGLHGAKEDTFENVMGKLFDLGLQAGLPKLDRRTEPFRKWIGDQRLRPRSGYLPVFHRTLACAFLAMMGYGEEEPIKEWIERRLDIVYPFAHHGDLTGVYVSPERMPSIPKAFRGTPLVDPSLYPGEDLALPWIHDINAFLHTRSLMEDPIQRSKVDTVIRFILTPGYQGLRPGYGVVKHGPRYYMMGWSVHLPGYHGSAVIGSEFGRRLLLLSLLARSGGARENEWFHRSWSSLTRYEDDHGLVSFPTGTMPEKRSGIWVLGMRMGLEQNRRRNNSWVSESTFRFNEIRHRLSSPL